MSYECKSSDDVLKVIKEDKIEMIDLRFTDLPGLWQHFSLPPRALGADSFSDGVGFDGSSIRGFQEIQESDMLVMPDPTTAFLDPFAEVPTLVLICGISDPISGQSYSRDPRYVAQKAEGFLRSTRLGDAAYFGPELEHFVFNEVHYDQGTNYGYYEIDAMEANWKARGGTGLGHKLRPKEGYFPVPPADALQDARSSMVIALERIGIAVEAHHHEVATGGQGEIDMRFAALTRNDKNALMEALKSVVLTDTPRGPIRFDHLGNVIGNFYVRRVEKANGKFVNRTLKTYENVSQFWTFDEKKFLEHPVYSRDYPALAKC